MASQIEEVKEKIDIVQIIGESVKLNKAGTNFKGLCPFHNEKSPSFMVSQELQIYKCFGCGVSGDVFTFLQEYEGMEFGEALRYLADKAGVKLQPMKGQQFSEKEKLLEIQELAVKFYKYILNKHSEGIEARKYLEQRGMKQKTIEQFDMGFAPNKPSSLSNFLKQKHNFTNNDLIEAGLAIQTQRGLIDRFRGRVIFPIYNHRGNAIALAGRILPQYDTGKVGKYINSPETPLYHKSRSLFGLNVTRSAIKRAGKAVVVEGELDAISSWQAGIENVVAIKGSALTEEQVLLLSRYAQTFVLALDADFAGDNAAIKAITQAQLKGIDVQVASMDPHKDPDEFAQNDPDGYKKALEDAIGVWDFMINISIERHDRTTGAGKAAISRELTPILASIPDQIVQSHYIGVLSQKLGVPTEAVSQQVSKNVVVKPDTARVTVKVPPPQVLSRREVLEEKSLSLIFQSDPNKYLTEKVVEMISQPVLGKIVNFFMKNKSKMDRFNPREFYNDIPAELQEKYSKLMLKEEFEENDLEKELKMTLHELELSYVKEKLESLVRQMADSESKNDEENLTTIQQEFSILSKRLAQLQD